MRMPGPINAPMPTRAVSEDAGELGCPTPKLPAARETHDNLAGRGLHVVIEQVGVGGDNVRTEVHVHPDDSVEHGDPVTKPTIT